MLPTTAKNIFFANGGETSITGYLKGAGYVNYTSIATGASTSKLWGFSSGLGKIVGNATTPSDFYSPLILTGYGIQATVGLSGEGAGGEYTNWFSYKRAQDAEIGSGVNATFFGYSAGGTLGIDVNIRNIFKKATGGGSGSVHRTTTTLLDRKVKTK